MVHQNKNMKIRKDVRIYVDMDNVLCDYQSAYDKALKDNPDIKYPQSQYGFFLNLEPMERSIEYFRLLFEKFDVWILTTPSVKNPMCYTEKRVWVEKYLGYEAAEKLIFSTNKSLLKGDFLIDDYDQSRAKQQDFEGELIHFGGKIHNDWIDVGNYFAKQYD